MLCMLHEGTIKVVDKAAKKYNTAVCAWRDSLLSRINVRKIVLLFMHVISMWYIYRIIFKMLSSAAVLEELLCL